MYNVLCINSGNVLDQCGDDENKRIGDQKTWIWALIIPICIMICLCAILLWSCCKMKDKSENSTELEDVRSDDGPPQHMSPNGNGGDDPGGTHDSDRTDTHSGGVRDCPTPGLEAVDGQTEEGQPLLSDPGAAGQDCERMGEAEDLTRSVNERSFDPVQSQSKPAGGPDLAFHLWEFHGKDMKEAEEDARCAPPLSQNVYAPVIRHCGRPEDMCIFIFSFVNTNSYQVLLQIQVMDYQTGAARYPCCLPES
ncbi:hypothetical protein FQA47_006922 [Oryzias melastigma]|uniref:Uncharacterized protein n=1 Tax=Oryzias melastigma TaxID=30732 RepID=A0A834CDY2_ORYME|nr:hypothetical protein FQA47_006922 [Oryzias melastigma]